MDPGPGIDGKQGDAVEGAVARRQQRLPAAVDGGVGNQVDIVEAADIEGLAQAAVQAVDLEPLPLVGADDQAAPGVAGIDSDDRVVGGGGKTGDGGGLRTGECPAD